MTNQYEAHLLSGAYALHAVTREEAELVEAAMAESEELHGEVVGLIDTAVTLGLAAPRMAPPPAMRARLLDSIGGLPQEPARTDVSSIDVIGSDTDRVGGSAQAGPAAIPVGRHMVTRRRRRARRPAALLAMAAAAVVLFSGILLVRGTLLEPQNDYSRIQAAADHQRATAQVAGGGTVQVLWSDSAHRTAVSLTGVRVPTGKTLQVWTIRGGSTVSDGLYPGGNGTHKVLDGAPASGEQLAVSIEPAGGSKQPTTKPIVQLPLEA